MLDWDRRPRMSRSPNETRPRRREPLKVRPQTEEMRRILLAKCMGPASPEEVERINKEIREAVKRRP